MTREEYIQKIERTQRKKSKRLKFIALTWIALTILPPAIMLGIVWFRVTRISDRAAGYLLYTSDKSFSEEELRTILNEDIGNDRQLQFLVRIYRGFGYALYPPMTLSLWPLLFLFRKKGTVYQEGLRSVYQLQTRLKDYMDEPSRLKRLALSSFVRKRAPSYSITPLPHGWYRTPQYKWFNSFVSEKKFKLIVHVLNRFDNALVKAIFLDKDLPRFSEAVEILQEFYFAVALQSDPILQNRRTSAAQGGELDVLYRFAKLSNGLILGVERMEITRRSKTIILLERLVQSRIVRYGFAVSGVAAVVMTVGALLFGINPAQAFLAWFAVSFGSLTISIGITSVALAKSKHDGQ